MAKNVASDLGRDGYAVANVRSRAVGVARTKVELMKSGHELIVTAVQEAVQRK